MLSKYNLYQRQILSHINNAMNLNGEMDEEIPFALIVYDDICITAHGDNIYVTTHGDGLSVLSRQSVYVGDPELLIKIGQYIDEGKSKRGINASNIS